MPLTVSHTDPLPQIKLDPRLRDEADRYVVNRISQIVKDCRDRNDWYTEMDNQLRGRGYAATRQPWGNSSLAEDPITREQHTTITAGFYSNIRSGDKYWQVEASDPNDEEAAMNVEAYLSIKPYEWGLPKHIYDVAYDAVRFPDAWVSCRWKQEYTTTFSTAYVDAKGKPVPDDQLTGTEKEVTLLNETVRYQGIEYRVPDPRDMYTDPPAAKDHQTCSAIFERMCLTQHDLLLGIEQFGYDYDAVLDMITHGPTSQTGTDWKTDLDEREGVGSDTEEYWECYQYIGKLPVLVDQGGREAFKVPRHLWNVDFVWMVCPALNKVFKFNPLPYEMRPYVHFHMLRTPRRAQGECVPSLLKPIQEELTVLMRWAINCASWGATPGWFIDKTQKRDFGLRKRFPGCTIEIDMAGGLRPEPIPNDIAGMQAGVELGSVLTSRATNMISGQSLQLQPKVRKATEIQADQFNVAQKFDLYYANFTTGLEDLAVLTISIAAQHEPDDGVYVRTGVNPLTVKITPQDLRRKFRYVPHANSENSNPQIRIQKWQAIMQAVMSSPVFAQSVQSGNLQMAWNLLRRFLEVNGERNVVGTIGPEPPDGPSPEFIMQQAEQGLMQLVQQLQKAGTPEAMQVAQAIQQIVQGAVQGAQQAGQGNAQEQGALAQQGMEAHQGIVGLLNGAGGGAGGIGGTGVMQNPHDVLAVNVGPQGFVASPFRSINQGGSGAPNPAMNGAG